ncbi:MAG: hypothetical protein A2W01_12570 [Candidatus Solincola sediminis]|uniref:Uncharacterized protein n=1 Tax=Candidatus Solincola sediminis TaxID=1797199 RepID=A0A1F2WK59_9ACTN|nr:MAG: hypothetical protein A2W01_12570 [Candidatus Solincola sediminis]OFW57236.1 MAG: hypothetical protein A2Y75_07335 [Candidatus Solincola sediminis]
MASRVAGRTVRDFMTAAPVWEILENWAQQTGYMPVSHGETSRLYQRGTGFLLAPQKLQVTWMGNSYRLEAWVKGPLFNRIVLLGLMPAEMIIDSGGFLGSPVRKLARGHVNMLLQALGQPPIN